MGVGVSQVRLYIINAVAKGCLAILPPNKWIREILGSRIISILLLNFMLVKD